MARIMVVEDEPITAADLEQKLAALGHEVAAWSDTGEDAVAQAHSLAPDLVLMDIRLRGAMNGIEAAERLRAQNDVPVVFLTAFADQDTVDRVCETQPYGYLLKPFTERSVATAVQVALARARAEQSHVERERWASAALRGAGEALVAVDESGAIRFVNEHAEALLNVQESAVLGRDARQIVQFSDAQDGAPHPLDSALREGRVISSPGRAVRVEGGTRPVISYSAAPVLTPMGAKAGAVLVFRRASARQAASGLERLDPLSSLSAKLAHEINNPLTYNLAGLHLAIRELDQLRALNALGGGAEGDGGAGQHAAPLVRLERLLRDAQEGATRVASVMRELGSFSLSARDLAPLHPPELLDLALGLSAVGSMEHVHLVREVAPVPMVRGNKWQLCRVLVYALHSALASLEPRVRGSTLEVAVRTDARGWVDIHIQARGQRASTTAARARTPAPEKTLTSVGGTIAESVVGGHGGELLVSDLPDGREISVRLPAMSIAPSDHDAPRRGSVLVVDDEPMIGRVLEITLQSEHDVTSVQSVEAALTLLETGDAFDAILCDLTMPGLGGQDLYERLSSSKPDLAARVIFMSGGACVERVSHFLKDAEDRCIEKPFCTAQLLPLIAQRVRMHDRAAAEGNC